MPNLPLSSLLICSRNRPQLLADTVVSILAGQEVPTEIVIIDQSTQPHPTLPTMQPERACEIRYCWSHSVGLSCARNEGVAASRHELIAIIDDDMYVAADWYENLLNALIQAGPQGVVTGQVCPYEETPGGFAPSLMDEKNPVTYTEPVMADVLSAGNMAIWRATMEAIGPFDERLGAGSSFPGAEDNDLALRLLTSGYRIVYVPEATVYHRAWRSKDDYLPLHWNYGYGQGAFFSKHLHWRNRFMIKRIWGTVVEYVGRNIRYIFRRSRLQVAADAVYLLGLFAGIIAWRIKYK